MNNKDIIALIGIYSYDLEANLYLLEMEINERPKRIDLCLFYQRIEGLPTGNWQTPYDEHFLTDDGTVVIGDFFSKNSIPGDKTHVVFFMFLEDLTIPLSTPYGEIDLSNVQPMPERLNHIISYNPID